MRLVRVAGALLDGHRPGVVTLLNAPGDNVVTVCFDSRSSQPGPQFSYTHRVPEPAFRALTEGATNVTLKSEGRLAHELTFPVLPNMHEQLWPTAPTRPAQADSTGGASLDWL